MVRGKLDGGEEGGDGVEVVVVGMDLCVEVREERFVGDGGGGAGKRRESGSEPAKEQKRKA